MAAFEGLDVCYPDGADWSCEYTDEQIAALDPRVKARSEALAWSTLAALTGFRLSICPSTIRPCTARCSPRTWQIAPVTDSSSPELSSGGAFSPYISDGSWYNGCGCSSGDLCSCGALCEVIMPTPVGSIVSVTLDGVELDPSAYRVDNGNRLVRTDGGECWPSCQNMESNLSEVGTFGVVYYPFVAPNDLFRYAAGVLAAEFYKACSGLNCRLPSGVTSISRAGISMDVQSGLFPGGATGITEVDAIIRIYNPNLLKSPARVLSPDSPRARVSTWS
jgi:hypothetical protein